MGLGTGHCQGETPSQFLRLTIACKRPPIASARASLRLSAAPEAWRSASNGRLSWSEQASNILSQYQAILDIAAYLSLNKLFGSSQEGSANQFRPASAERAILIMEAFWSNPEVGEGHGGIPAKISDV